MVELKYVPEQGDFVTINSNPQKGHEQAGHRPAVIISPRSYNGKTGLCLACPITNSIKGYPFEVECKSKGVTEVILADQVKSLDWRARDVRFKEKAKQEILDEIIGKLNALIGI